PAVPRQCVEKLKARMHLPEQLHEPVIGNVQPALQRSELCNQLVEIGHCFRASMSLRQAITAGGPTSGSSMSSVDFACLLRSELYNICRQEARNLWVIRRVLTMDQPLMDWYTLAPTTEKSEHHRCIPSLGAT